MSVSRCATRRSCSCESISSPIPRAPCGLVLLELARAERIAPQGRHEHLRASGRAHEAVVDAAAGRGLHDPRRHRRWPRRGRQTSGRSAPAAASFAAGSSQPRAAPPRATARRYARESAGTVRRSRRRTSARSARRHRRAARPERPTRSRSARRCGRNRPRHPAAASPAVPIGPTGRRPAACRGPAGAAACSWRRTPGHRRAPRERRHCPA